MIYIFSWGGGVNSTAILAMIKLGMLPELTKENTHIVFGDTGAEMPYTYEHTTNCLQPMARDGWVVKVLNPHNQPELYSPRCQNKTLPEYCHDKQVIPSRINRWCTMEWKSNPIKNYRISLVGKNYKEHSIMILGIGAEEKHRARELGVRWTMYPLVDRGIDRDKCYELVEKAGLPKPRKSGCFFCPYQRKEQWIDLYKNYSELFSQAEECERWARAKFDGDGYYLRNDLPIREQIKKWARKEKCEPDLFELDRHCLCEL